MSTSAAQTVPMSSGSRSPGLSPARQVGRGAVHSVLITFATNKAKTNDIRTIFQFSKSLFSEKLFFECIKLTSGYWRKN